MYFRIEDLSPTGTETALCIGSRYIYKNCTWGESPNSYALVIALKNTTETMLIKMPVSVGNLKAKHVKELLIKNDIIGVKFTNLKIWHYSFTDKKTNKLKQGYTGTADDFEIIE